MSVDNPSPGRGYGSNLVCGLILALMAVVIALLRLHTLHEPFNLDLMVYAVNAHELRHGAVPYLDVWELKPPLIMWTFQLAECLFGYNDWQIYALGVASAWLTLAGIYLAGQSVGGRRSGLLAAGLWTLVSGTFAIEANQPNAEVFINVCVVWFFVFLLAPRRWGLWPSILALGVLAAAASLYKQFLAVEMALLLLAGVLFPATGISRKMALRIAGASMGVMLGIWVGVLAYLRAVGGLQGFLDITFKGGQAYAGDPIINLMVGLFPHVIWPYWMTSLAPLAAFGAAGDFLGVRGTFGREWKLFGALVATTFFTVSLPGRYFPHYYQLYLPLLAIGGSWTVVTIAQRYANQSPHAGRVSHAIYAVIAAFIVVHEARYFALSADELSFVQSRAHQYQEVKKLGVELRQWVPEGETFFQWGMAEGLYFYSQRRPTTCLDSALLNEKGSVFKAQNPMYAQFYRRFIADMETKKPSVVVIGNYWGHNSTAYDYIMQKYEPFPKKDSSGHFSLWVRKGSALQRRLRQTPLPAA